MHTVESSPTRTAFEGILAKRMTREQFLYGCTRVALAAACVVSVPEAIPDQSVHAAARNTEVSPPACEPEHVVKANESAYTVWERDYKPFGETWAQFVADNQYRYADLSVIHPGDDLRGRCPAKPFELNPLVVAAGLVAGGMAWIMKRRRKQGAS